MSANCPKKPAQEPRRIELPKGVETRGLAVALECPRTWERLEPTEEDGIRRCGACEELVYEAWSEQEAHEHIGAGHCVVQMHISLSARGRPKVAYHPPPADLEACRQCGAELDLRQPKCDQCGSHA